MDEISKNTHPLRDNLCLIACVEGLLKMIRTEGLPDRSPAWRKAVDVAKDVLKDCAKNT
jgi:hypothetical protein